MGSTIEVLRVSGSHREVGAQVGSACADIVQRLTSFGPEQLPEGRTLDDQLALAAEYRSVTREELPWIVEECDAIAEAAGVDALRYFAASVEEIWPRPADETPGDRVQRPTPGTRGCTDVAAVGSATTGAKSLIAHTNDLPAGRRHDIRPIEWRVSGFPTTFTLGVGPWVSVGWNATGLSNTGNELAPNDERIGIPRLLLSSAVSRASTLPQAKALAAHPRRASSYNWMLADAAGAVVSLEGSATSGRILEPDERGLLHHENHYAHPDMARFERGAYYAQSSARRGRRVHELLEALPSGTADRKSLRALMSDHQNGADAICRHPSSEEATDEVATVFWCVADPMAGSIDYGIGQPCNSGPATTYTFV